MKTYTPKEKEIKQDWHLVDAKGQLLGKVAADIAKLLLGKHKAIYSTHMNVGDKVVVTNVEGLEFTGTKLDTKVYHWHTGYPGGIRSQTLRNKMEKKPEDVLKLAVKGMLPKNKLQKVRMSNLYIYKGSEHPHTAHIK